MVKKPDRAVLPDTLFCDASFLIAYFATNDRSHPKALRIRQRLASAPVKLVTSWPAVSEASTILLYHYGYSHAVALLQVLSTFSVVSPSESEYAEGVSLFQRFNKDQKFSFNDVLTCALIRGRLKNIPILTFDRDFAKMGLTIFTAY